MTAIRRARVVLRGLLAAVILVALVAGVPALLLATIGNPIPTHWTGSTTLTNSALLGILACVAWVFWAQLLVCVVVEVIAEVRFATGRSADWLSRVPWTLSAQQALSRTLVEAVAAIGVTTTAAAAAATPWIASAAAATESPPVAAQEPRVVATASLVAEQLVERQHRSTTEVAVVRGDTLWSIAERRLGAGERWREIAALNRGRHMLDGSTFDDTRTILPGWTLLVPSPVARHGDQHVVTVERGDTLWEIADEEYGDGTKWPRIYKANDHKIGDPHWIYPGEQFVVPAPRVVGPQKPKVDRPADPSATHVSPPADPPATDVSPGDPPATHVSPPVRTPKPAEKPRASGHLSPDVSVSPTAPDSVDQTGTGQGDASDYAGPHVDGATTAMALLGGGGFLAAGLLAVYVGRRRTQSRNRRSGSVAPPVAAHLRAEAKALRRVGSAASQRTAFFDTVLRELAAMAEQAAFDLPEVVSARIDSTTLDLHLRTSSPAAPAPWLASSDALIWSVFLEHQPPITPGMSPYPAMVTVGEDELGGTWLIDLEAAGVVQIVGERTAGDDLARFIGAELALNPWSDVESVEILGFAHDVVPLNPGRLFAEARLDVERLGKVARQMVDSVNTSGRGVLLSRVADGESAWLPRLCVASVGESELETVRIQTAALLDEMERTPGRTSVAFIAVAAIPLDQRATTLAFTADGNLQTPWSVVRPNRLTAGEAAMLGELFDDAETEGDVEIPPAVDAKGEPTDFDQAGALTEPLTAARCGTGDPSSILPRPDEAYVESAATTVEDLAVLAPAVPPSGGVSAIAADPSLDQDLADWADPESQLPKLRVLGPVELHASGERTKEVETRPAYFAELAAYLACHPVGQTPNQVAADFGIQNNTLHTRLGQLRKWLGTKPGTEEWYLPPAQRVRGQQVYRLSGVLTDADLFRRLRARGEARGPQGIDDYRKALELVAGKPYDQPRPRGYGWLVDAPVDHYLTAAIVDVAHVFATHSLAEDQPSQALWAAEKAIAAAPYEDKPRLDLARAKQASGGDAEVQRYLQREVFNRSDDDRAPLDPSDRTMEVVDRMDRYGNQ